jgi:hypothetical protein
MRRAPRLRSGALALALAALSLSATGAEPAAEPEWRSFSGTWSASGRRHVVPVEGGALAATVEVSGAVVLDDAAGLSRGFRGEAIGLDDGHGLSVARCVWTDENGDQVFSRLDGQALQAGRTFRGTITGGTGRYEALEGEYSFTWQYVVTVPGEGVMQGRAVGLSGRARRVAAPR